MVQKLKGIVARHYTALFLIALATVVTQLLVSRIVSVTLYYHFAFASITFAMLGLTAGALKVYRDSERYSAARVDAVLAANTAAFARNIIMAVLMHIYVPGLLPAWLFNSLAEHDLMMTFCVAPSIALLLLAFINSGVCIALLLTRFPDYTGKLYAFDFCGAATGCIVVLLALMIVDPVTTFFLLSCVLSVLAWRFLPDNAGRSAKRVVKTTAIVLMCMGAVQLVSCAMGVPVFRLLWTKDARTANFSRPDYERWNSYSRIAIWDQGEGEPFSWGFGIPHHNKVAQKGLNIDGWAYTVITKFNGNTEDIAYLKDDIVNLGYQVRNINNVAVIGAGGGRDVLSALAFNTKHIKGIEMNPITLHAINDVYGDYTGHLDRRPGVSFANAEARSYLSSHPDHYDLIQISLIDTWAATASGGLALTENTLYTTDAWNDFLDRLNENGLLVLTRWKWEENRLFSMAGKLFQLRSPGANPRQHILAATVGDVVTMLISKSPYSAEEVKRFEAICKTKGFTPVLTPTMAADGVAAMFASGKADENYFSQFPLDTRPPNDDRPFFFNMVRPSDFLKHFSSNDVLGVEHSLIDNNKAVNVLFEILAIVSVASFIYIIWPLVSIYRAHNMKLAELTPYILYFGAIGIGFMLIEISQMQRLMIFLGHPSYSLSVVLFTLLLFSGVGSYAQTRIPALHRTLWLIPAMLCAVLIATGLLTPVVVSYLKYYGTAVRIPVSAMLLVPMGLVMGMMFPLGVSVARERHEHMLPWYWGINGIASVFASVCSILLSLQFGISSVFWDGVCCYAVCVLVMLYLARRRQSA